MILINMYIPSHVYVKKPYCNCFNSTFPFISTKKAFGKLVEFKSFVGRMRELGERPNAYQQAMSML